MADAWGWNKKDEKFQYEGVDSLLVYAFDKLNDLKMRNK